MYIIGEESGKFVLYVKDYGFLCFEKEDAKKFSTIEEAEIFVNNLYNKYPREGLKLSIIEF